jgi:hypothetical protein
MYIMYMLMAAYDSLTVGTGHAPGEFRRGGGPTLGPNGENMRDSQTPV